MAIPLLMLGGVPIVLHAGAPELTEQPIGGSTVLRMDEGRAVKMQHWERQAGSISGQGWMPPGLDGLDYSQQLELRSTQQSNIVGAGLVYELTSTPRPDVAPWAQALVGKAWRGTACSYDPDTNTVTIEPVEGATLYQASWLPVYRVFATRPAKTQNAGHGWNIPWEEA